MPAAVLENTPQEAFGRNLANRRCSERQRSQYGRFDSGREGRKGSMVSAVRTGRSERQGIEAVTEPPGGTARVPRTGANRLTGPDAGTDVRVMKAGSFGNHRSETASPMR